MIPSHIGVLGAGSFGTALAHLLSQQGHRVKIWARNKKIAKGINQKKINPVYLKDIKLSRLTATTDLDKVCYQKDLLLFVIPSQFVRSILKKIKKRIPQDAIIVNAAKGIEQKSLMTMSGVFKDVLGKNIEDRFAVLSGPTFALELARRFPSGAAIASKNLQTAHAAQQILSTEYFRLYAGRDVIGVELGGSLKNVMAIGTAIGEGLGFGLNTRAGHITRCLHEMIKLGVALGANPFTFSGLSGLGDLVLTCTGDLSRNRFVGLELGKGRSLKEITKKMKSIAEGIATAKSVYELAQEWKIEMVNVEYIYKILYEGLSPKRALKEILSRELKDEMAGLASIREK